MARLRNIVHSDDACTMIFEGNKSKAEPSCGIIKFPGGRIEVSRTSTQTYWVHISIDNHEFIVGSRIDYEYEHSKIHRIPEIPDQEFIQHIAVEIDRNIANES